jgi:hypothetical protein
MRTIAIAILPVVLMLSPACIIVDHERPHCIGDLCGEDLGDIEFYWSFEMWDDSVTNSCADAEISRMDVYIFDSWGDLEFRAQDRPCEEMGAIIDNFYPGTYELQLTGICRTGLITHEGYWDIDIYSGTNDYDELVLPYLSDCL